MRKITTFAFAVFAVFTVAACQPQADTTRQGNVAQEGNMQRAIEAHPVPTVERFTTRETVTRWIESANQPDQTHYIYVMLPGVGPIGYYVADSAPVNICTALTPPVREYKVGGGTGPHPLGPSPALDGVYYGGGCDMFYFFEVGTGAKMEIGGNLAFFTSMVPLSLDIPRLTVEIKE